SAMALLERYEWPGNIRELRNVMERAVLLLDEGEWIESEHLPLDKFLAASQPESEDPPDDRAAVLPHRYDWAENAPPDDLSDDSLRDRIKSYETKLILDALGHANGNVRVAAARLKIPARTLTHRLKMLGIQRAFTPPLSED